MDNPEAIGLADVTMQSANPNAETDQPAPKKRSVNNMKPDALQKKRENDRNAQRNIREKQRRTLKMLQDQVEELKGLQNPELLRQLAESQSTVRRLVDLLTQHGIEAGPALSPIQDNILGALEMDACGSTASYQSQQYSQNSHQMFPIGPPQPMAHTMAQPMAHTMAQPMMQSQHSARRSIQYVTESPQSHFTGSPESLGHSHVHSSPSLTGSPHFGGSPHFAVQSQPMGTIQHMGALYTQSPSMQPVPAFHHMNNPHAMTNSHSMGLMQSTPQVKFENPGFQSYPPLETWHYGAPQPTQPQPWTNNANFRSNQVMATYPGPLDDITLTRA